MSPWASRGYKIPFIDFSPSWESNQNGSVSKPKLIIRQKTLSLSVWKHYTDDILLCGIETVEIFHITAVSFSFDQLCKKSILSGTPSSTETTASATPNGPQLSPTNGIGNGPAGGVVGVGGRKRPLLAGGLRTSMTPTKRTVMSLLARARAAQAKQLPSTFQRGTPE